MIDAIIKNAVPYRMRSPSDIFLDNSLAVLEGSLRTERLRVETLDWANLELFDSITDHETATKVMDLILKGETRSEEYVELQKKQDAHLRTEMAKKNKDLADRLKREKVPVLGEKTFFGDAWANSKELYQSVREYSPETLIVAGGPHASVWREKIFSDSGADFFVIGPGQAALMQIIQIRKQARSRKEAVDIITRMAEKGMMKNVMYHGSDGNIRLSALAEVNANSNHMPSYNHIRKEDGLFPLQYGKNNLHVAVDSLGCFWNQCIPCCHKHNVSHYNERNPASFVDEIEHFVAQGIGFFRKGGSGAKLSHQLACAEEMLKRGLNVKYSSFMRAEPGARENSENLVKAYMTLIRSGLVSIGIGGESGSAETNLLLKKGLTPDDVKYTTDAVHKASTRTGVHVDIILYMIYPTAITEGMSHDRIFQENVEFVKAISPTSAVIGPEGAFYGAELYSRMHEYGVKVGTDFDRTMPLFEYTTFLPKEYWRKIDYEIGGLAFDDIIMRTGSLLWEISKAGIMTDCTDEQVVFARGAGFQDAKGLEEFYKLAVADLVSCQHDFIRKTSKLFNETSREIALEK